MLNPCIKLLLDKVNKNSKLQINNYFNYNEDMCRMIKITIIKIIIINKASTLGKKAQKLYLLLNYTFYVYSIF